MSNLKSVFKNRKAFIPFVVADDPDFDTTVANVVALANNGADIVEIGIPFSDPVADGPVIQAADLRAFENDVTPTKIFAMVAEIRKQTAIPIVFLTYLNIVFKYGYDAFCQKCQALQIDGLVIPDMPYESRTDLAPFADKYNIDLIPLITPTSGHRIEKIAQAATGFIYVVSSLGITGQRDSFDEKLTDLVTEINKYTTIPTAIGFGIHTPEQAQHMATIADGAIIGSAIVDIVAQYKQDAPTHLAAYAQTMRQALDNATEKV
ncbi:tryptophan synthase subunit alpha [Agrilactobacillus yilanensis]|uniref:Tryptophan synthase alpha chain n=1 Tax=Agrilactobacillus yilanensis TaxID=2485997 RepID=A0ABW4J8H9_9LACO|nr:tryptophan synthase subunit alpha [Agrilactobacillus yilanensis]